MSVRAELKSIRILLDEVRARAAPLSEDDASGLAERLTSVDTRIAQQPQFSAVRPATIALRNLIVSLRRPELSIEIDDELDTAIEAIEALLGDTTFGFEGEELRGQVEAALRARGAHACSACKRTELTIELVYLLVKPLPSDAALAPSQLPCALVACKHCGALTVHDLGVLGVSFIPRS